MMSKLRQIVVRMPPELIERIDQHVDRIQYHSRNQLINLMVGSWLENAPAPISEQLDQYGAENRTKIIQEAVCDWVKRRKARRSPRH